MTKLFTAIAMIASVSSFAFAAETAVTPKKADVVVQGADNNP
jgi:hypothetical protein